MIVLQNTWRRLHTSQRCERCGAWSDRGHVLQYLVAVEESEFRYGYFCVTCGDEYEFPDKPIGAPPRQAFAY